jgi:MOSC domain-containing protein YiiM
VGHVVSIVYTPRDVAVRKPQDRFARVSVERVTLVEFCGIDGDAKGGTGDRQLNVMLAEFVAELGTEGFKTAPGELGEQIVLAGLDVATITKGTHLKIGAAVIAVGIPRTGCARFELIQGKTRQSAAGRLGFLATVVTGGEVAVGDAVEALPTSSS